MLLESFTAFRGEIRKKRIHNHPGTEYLEPTRVEAIEDYQTSRIGCLFKLQAKELHQATNRRTSSSFKSETLTSYRPKTSLSCKSENFAKLQVGDFIKLQVGDLKNLQQSQRLQRSFYKLEAKSALIFLIRTSSLTLKSSLHSI